MPEGPSGPSTSCYESRFVGRAQRDVPGPRLATPSASPSKRPGSASPATAIDRSVGVGDAVGMTTDEEAIRNLIGRHAQLTDDGLAEERVQLYVKDGVFIQGDQRYEGHDAITTAFSAGKDPARRGKHITSNMVIELEGDKADVRTDFAMVKPSP